MIAVSCKKSEQEIITHQHSATIKVTVYKLLSNGNQVFIKGALVQLYKSKDDRDAGLNEEKEGLTDSTGMVSFFTLTEEYYYIKSSHPSYGTEFEEVNTPDKTVSFVDIIY